MKRFFLILALFIVFTSSFARRTIFSDSRQQWDIVDIRSNNDYTAIICEVTFLSNRAGCMDAHTYDKRNSSIYIYGNFGKKELIASEFNGDYKPWEMYQGRYEWNYFRGYQKGKKATATFYFTRIPAGIKTFNWHFDGGWADRTAPSRKYRTPKFDVYNIEVQDNVNPTSSTGWSERKLKEYWKAHKLAPIEGIYSFLSTSNTTYWGTIRHRLAIKKDGEQYQIIYLHGSNEYIWSEGEIKAIFSPTTSKGVYKVDMWYLDNKTLSPSELYIEYNNRKITIYDATSCVETHFMKLFPAYDVEESDVSPLYPQTPPIAKQDTATLIGNGSGFFVSENILATNYHVVKDAKKLEIVINNGTSISKYNAKTLCVDKINDIALVQIDDVKFSPLLQIPYLLLSDAKQVGTDVYTMGYPAQEIMGQEIKVTDGIISSKTGYQGDISTYQISAPIQPGNSGGPLFCKDGKIIGITSSGIPGADNVGYAIKASYLKILMESAPIEIKDIFRYKNLESNLTEQIKLFTPYVVMILVY